MNRCIIIIYWREVHIYDLQSHTSAKGKGELHWQPNQAHMI